MLDHIRIISMRVVAKNLREEGSNSRAACIDELIDECLRLRQGLWDVAKACGADTDGNETPAPFASDLVEFALSTAQDLRLDYDGMLEARG